MNELITDPPIDCTVVLLLREISPEADESRCVLEAVTGGIEITVL